MCTSQPGHFRGWGSEGVNKKRKKNDKDVTCVEHLFLLNSKGFRLKAF